MATPRRDIIDPKVPGTYHCFSKCVRNLHLLGGTNSHRKMWLENRMFFLAKAMAIDIMSFAILGNHFHMVLKNRPDVVKNLEDDAIAERYLTIYPESWKRRKKGIPDGTPPLPEEIAKLLANEEGIKKARVRLACISDYMALLKQPLSVKVNAEDGTKGTMWAGRFRSVRAVDKKGVLCMSIYVDLNLVRAGIAKYPEDSLHTSIYYRIERFLNRCPPAMATRAALLANISGIKDGKYIELVDATARRFTPDKHSIPETDPSIQDRFDLSEAEWHAFITANEDRLRGTAVGTKESVAKEAKRRGKRWMWNVVTHVKKKRKG